MYKNYTNYDKQKYNPKKQVKTFQDLEVYQKALEASVFVANEIVKKCDIKDKDGVEAKIVECLTICSMKIPHLICEAHSSRFGESTKCLEILDQTMLQCNKAVVYLEQTRDIVKPELEWEKFDELIQKYFYIRRKVLNLQRVWRKYIVEKTD